MIKIEVNSASFDMKSGTSARTGKAYSIREQEAWAFLCDRDGKPQPHPQRIKLTLADEQAPYNPGLYQLDPSSIFVGDFSQLNIRARLRPLAAASVPAQPKAA